MSSIHFATILIIFYLVSVWGYVLNPFHNIRYLLSKMRCNAHQIQRHLRPPNHHFTFWRAKFSESYHVKALKVDILKPHNFWSTRTIHILMPYFFLWQGELREVFTRKFYARYQKYIRNSTPPKSKMWFNTSRNKLRIISLNFKNMSYYIWVRNALGQAHFPDRPRRIFFFSLS